MTRRSLKRTKHRNREGTTIVELAVTFPLFLTVLFATIELAHAIMTTQVLNAGARRAARLGVIATATNDTISSEARKVIRGCVDSRVLTIDVHDGSIFDSVFNEFETIDISSLDTVEVSDLDSRGLFVVRTSVKLRDIAIFTPQWLTGDITLSGRSVARRE